MSPVPVAENTLRAEAKVRRDVPRISLESINHDTVTRPLQADSGEEAPEPPPPPDVLHKLRKKRFVGTCWLFLVLLALLVVNPATEAMRALSLVASAVVAGVFLAYQAIILLTVEKKFQRWQMELLAAFWIWLLCFLVSTFSSPSRRELMGGGVLTNWREDPGNSTAALWIVLVLFLAAVTVQLSFVQFFVLGQVVSFQHLLIGALLPIESSGEEASLDFGGPTLALPPWLVPSLQLHALAMGLSVVRLWQERDEQVHTAVQDYLEGKEVPDVLAPGRGGAGAIKTRIEMITELLDSEIGFLSELMSKVSNLAASHQAHLDWLRAADFLLELLQSCADVLKQTNSTDELQTPFQEQLSELGVTGWTGAPPTTARTERTHIRDRTDSEMSSRNPNDVPAPSSSLHLPGALSPQGSSSLKDMSAEALTLPVGRDPAEDSMTAPEAIPTYPFSQEDVRSVYGVADWAFDALEVTSQVGGVLKLVGKEFLSPQYWLPKEHLPAFLETLESRYDSNNPYHSNVHAADMTNSVYFMLENCGLQERCDISETSVTTMILAALGHDVGHPGYNNNFLINARHAYAITYSDRSVLENFHAAELMRLLSGDVKGVNFLGGLSEAEQKQERYWITSLILSTDMSKLMQDLSSLRMKISSGSISVEDPGDQQLVLGWLFRSADIGHSAKPWDIHQAWSVRVVAEFHGQGDEEIRLGLPVSPLCSRTDFKLGKSQAGFLQFVCLPTFLEIKNLEEIFGLEDKENETGLTSPGTPLVSKMASNASGFGSPVPTVDKKRTERNTLIQGGGQGRRRSIAQLVSQKSRADMTPSPSPSPSPGLSNLKSPETTPRLSPTARRWSSQREDHSLSHRGSVDAKVTSEDVLRVPGSESHRRNSQGSGSSKTKRGGWSKSSTNSSLNSRARRILNARVYLQCKENMETWQKMAAEEEAPRHILSSPNVSKGSASLAPVSSGSSET